MPILKDIIHSSTIDQIIGATDVLVMGISFDSRTIEKDYVFIATKGLQADGHEYIDKAIKNGANTVVCQDLPVNLNKEITYIKVKDSQVCLATIANEFYDNPSKKLKLIGITGTNGKTTLATLSYDIFSKAGYNAGLISTVNIKLGDTIYKTFFTTPDSLTINQYLSEMVKQGVTHCFMEVSSHGIAQKRIHGLTFYGGVFTNLTHDHLDYHKDFGDYRNVKKSFFDDLPKQSFALTNADDKNGLYMLQNTSANKKTYSLKTIADYKAKIIENSIQGLHLKINGDDVWTQLIGSFNAYNLIGIYAIAKELGLEHRDILQYMSLLQSVTGRFQHFESENGITTIIDYAHTPDALKNVLHTIKDISKHTSKIITIVGCGGDRDKAKRPIMADIASSISDASIFTSDNPRTENPQSIIDDMVKGIKPENEIKTLNIIDRKEAIKTGFKLAQPGDILLIAGKGHETYQEINGVRHDFDDYQIALELIKPKQKA